MRTLSHGSFLVLMMISACTATPDEDGLVSSTSGSGSESESGSTGGKDGGTTAGPGDTSGSTSDASSSGGESGSETGETGEDPDPVQTDVCNDNGTCDGDETCSACPGECGSCDVEDLPDQRAKYIDGACPSGGDGLSDACADAPGGPGRFNDLQVAIDSLVAGDTLYIHPGDYWRSVPPSDSGGVFFYESEGGTAEQPVVITAANRDEPPVLHSCDPSNPQDCPSAALTIVADHTIVDHLRIHGRVQMWAADQSVLQYLECTQGWGACGDGNWACLRIEAATGCVAHHNWVHDVSGDGFGESCPPGQSSEFPDRGSGLKEFTSDGTIWEFNTVDDAPYWGYDLHRNSVRTTIRFNDFRSFHVDAVRVQRTNDTNIYGNQMVGQPGGGGHCVDIGGENEANPGQQVASVHHNTCARTQTGIAANGSDMTSHDNIVADLLFVDEPPRNVAIALPEDLDHNAYDSTGNYRYEPYEPDTWYETLEAWAEAVGGEGNSQAEPGGVCTFVAEVGEGDEYDLAIASGVCSTMGSEGGEIGAYGVTSCVGHMCG